MQHLVGVGHQRRSAAIARALAVAGVRVCYVSGGRALDDLNLDSCEFVQLPALRSLDMQYHTLVDEHDQVIDEQFRSRRRDQLLSVLEGFQPDVVVTETWPFGRGLMRFELEPLMQAIQGMRPKPLLVSSIRDIVEPRAQVSKFEKMARRVETYFDHVLVHADPALLSFADSFPLFDRIQHKLHYTGYVSTSASLAVHSAQADGAVVVSAGGGFFGEHLLRTAIEAQPLSIHARHKAWQIMVGPNLAQARFEALREMAPVGVTVQRNRSDFHDLLRHCLVSVSQGGYNTVVDLLALRVPAVVVPYEDEREHEQAIRAKYLAQRDLAQVVSYDALSAMTLAQAIDKVLTGWTMPAVTIDLNGADNSAQLLIRLADSVSNHNAE